MRQQADAVVTCTNCGDKTALSILGDENRCPGCGERIDPDAPTKMRREVVDGNWDKVIDNEPIGGVDFCQDEISEPARDLDEITEVLTDAEKGDRLALDIGMKEASAENVLLVVSVKTGDRDDDFEHHVSLITKPREDGWTRMYMTGYGGSELGEWEVVSVPYYVPDGTADVRDFAGNGWIIDAEPTDEPVTQIPDNEDER